MSWTINSSPPEQRGCHFADDILKCILFCILIWISLKFVTKGLIDNKASIGSGKGLAPTRRQAITWTNASPIQWHIYVALEGDESTNLVKQVTGMISNHLYEKGHHWTRHNYMYTHTLDDVLTCNGKISWLPCHSCVIVKTLTKWLSVALPSPSQ